MNAGSDVNASKVMRCMQCRRAVRTAGFTVLELLVTIAIIGILAGLLLPAVVWARESARRTQCVNHLHQIGTAMQLHHDNAKRLPEAWQQAKDGISGYGWAIQLLPYLDEQAVHAIVSNDLPITAPQNEAARSSDLVVMRCPSDIAVPTFELYAEGETGHHSESPIDSKTSPDDAPITQLPTANYAGVFGTIEADETFPAPSGDGPIVQGHRVRLQDLQRGLSHTILVGERTAAMVPTTWLGVNFLGEDAACRLVGSAITAPSCDFCDECEFASRHTNGANFVWADGHVSLINRDIDQSQYQSFSKRR
jgi:prepilin-type processing-associated H-X9-DG protein/prepilin-type N-terminal cleavage/methylation domain-containing protein